MPVSLNEKSEADQQPALGSNNAVAHQYGGRHSGDWVDALPKSWVPFVQLSRLSPPAGLLLIVFPHFFGVFHAAQVHEAPPVEVVRACLIMLGGSFFANNASHAWNDLVDVDLDRQVARTKQRPIARGAISTRAAFIFACTQAAAAAAFLALMPLGSVAYAVPNIIATAYYPYAKRHTFFAQFVLGFCLAWGVIVGSCAVGLRLLDSSTTTDVQWSTALLTVACIFWTVIYDTIYALQDISDDLKLGLRSTAILFGTNVKPALWLVLACMLGCLAGVGYLDGMGIGYYLLAVGGCLASLSSMLTFVNLQCSANCWWWFRHGFWLVGGSVSGGLLWEYAANWLV